MTFKQLSIFIENKQGTLIKVLSILKEAGIQIIASTVADTLDNGIYRIICDEPERAYLMLSDAGLAVNITEVNAIELDDVPGKAADALAPISGSGADIAYLYSFLLNGKGILVYRTR